MRVRFLIPAAVAALFLNVGAHPLSAEPRDTPAPDGPLSFPVDEATLHNARQGQDYGAELGGLLSGGDRETEFSKVDGDDWIQVSPDGALSGTPQDPAEGGPPSEGSGPGGSSAGATVEATAADGSSARLEVDIPVRGHDEPLVEELGVMSFNTWHGGTQVDGHHEKQVRFLLESGADVVGLQETAGEHAERLAEALGWYHWQGSDSLGVISRYPIAEEYGEVNASGGVRIELDGEESQVNLWNVHLGYTPYGPYDFCFDGMDVEEVLDREAESGRTPEITDTLDAMSDQVEQADDVPVLLVGDFNAPSHLDWTEELREENCGYADVPWPTSTLPAEAGFTDSYRVARPDPAEEPGHTWSPLFPYHEGSTGPEEPQDRIDFVYHAGDLTVRDSHDLVVGDPAPSPDHEDNEWTSDHAAVLTTYSLPS
ncbi:endonuclease/exonuclease/phosphatase family protein [Nocardiopsis salina]|uniref:endonuclease/exonuclease/phosphatase family protein n=1 Tax=Nocardiopsis salina TaxID=245836 RepID=UPI0003449F1A|nr:endonuclease/exonuclease/phosphatase family protein [Nocardiopsis salina]